MSKLSVRFSCGTKMRERLTANGIPMNRRFALKLNILFITLVKRYMFSGVC